MSQLNIGSTALASSSAVQREVHHNARAAYDPEGVYLSCMQNVFKLAHAWPRPKHA